MKRLSTYFEGLLSGRDKSSVDSSNIDKCSEFIEDNIKVKSYVPFEYSISNKTVQFINMKDKAGAICEISAYHIDVLCREYRIEKLILNGNWTIRIDQFDCDLPIEINCDSYLYLVKKYDGSRRHNMLKNIAIKSHILSISDEVKIARSIINTTTLYAYNLTSFISNKIQAENIMFRFSKTNKKLLDFILKTQVPTRTKSSGIAKANWSLRDPNRINEILHINPQEVFGLNKCNVNNIVIYPSDAYDSLLFTKKPNAFKSTHDEQYVMADGWYAMWAYSNNIRKQIEP